MLLLFLCPPVQMAGRFGPGESFSPAGGAAVYFFPGAGREAVMPPAAHFPLAGKVGKGALKGKPFRSGFPLRIPFARPRDPAGPLGSPGHDGETGERGKRSLPKRRPPLWFSFLDHEPSGSGRRGTAVGYMSHRAPHCGSKMTAECINQGHGSEAVQLPLRRESPERGVSVKSPSLAASL